MDAPTSGRLQLLRDYATLFGGELASRLLGLAAFAYLARTLDRAAYGTVELAVAISFFFSLLIEFGLGVIGAREVARDPTRAQRLAGEIPGLRLLLALGVAPCMAVTVTLLASDRDALLLLWLYALALLAFAWNQRWLFQGLDRMGWVGAATIARAAVFTLAVVVLVHDSFDLAWVGAAEVAATAAMALLFVAGQRRARVPIGLRFSLGPMRGLARSAAPIALAQATGALTRSSPVFLVALLLGTGEAAPLAVAYRIVMAAAVFTQLHHFNLFPVLTRRLARSRRSFEQIADASFRVTAWAGLGLALVGTLLAEPACGLVFGKSFEVAAPLLSVLVWTLPVQLLSGHAPFALIAQGHQRSVLVAQATGAGVMLALGAGLVLLLGALGAALSLVAARIAVWCVAHAYARIRVGSLPLARPLALPLAAVVAILAADHAWQPSPWLSAPLAAGAFALAGLVLDRRLLPSLALLGAAKDDAAVQP